MKTKVSLKGLKFFAYHGYYDEERKKGNDFICDVQVELKSFDALDDNIHDTVNYEDLFKIVEVEMQNTRKLLETVAYSIISKIKELDNVVAASVSLSKLNPPIKGQADSAVVKMEF